MVLNSVESLLDFKKYIQEDIKKYCIDKYGKRVFNMYINQVLDDMLESFEDQIELAGIETMRDDEIKYSLGIIGEE